MVNFMWFWYIMCFCLTFPISNFVYIYFSLNLYLVLQIYIRFFIEIFVIFFISDFFSINKKQCLIVFVFKTVNIYL